MINGLLAGARETHWFGLDAQTGNIVYECGSGGCSSEEQTAGAGRDVLVLRRQSSTVRALDPRNGNEKLVPILRCLFLSL